MFIRKHYGKITMLLVYADDRVVTNNEPAEGKALQNHPFREFEMKDLGPPKYVLRI